MQRLVVLVLAVLGCAQSQSQAQKEDVPALECPSEALASGRCARAGSPSGDQVFTLDGGNSSLVVTLSGGDKLGVRCALGVPLGASWAPAYRRELPAALVALRGCALPAGGAAAGLVAMRVRPPIALQLLALPPGPMPDDALAGLDRLKDLQLQAPVGNHTATSLPAVTLTHVPRLIALRAERVTVPLDALPRSLETLWLLPPEPVTLDARWASRMLQLKKLAAHGADTRAEWSTCPSALQRVALDRLVSAEPGLWTGCERLETLRVRGGTADALPSRWLAALSALRAVTVERLPLSGGVPEDLLHESPQLRKLELRACGLRSLPQRLLRDAPLLEELDLSDNSITTLSGDWLGSASRLQTLVLAGNPLESLPSVPQSLVSLDASRAALGDTCGVGAVASPLQRVTSLRRLLLRRTNATRLCVDWRLALTQLDLLDLRDNNITELLAADLRWARADGVRSTVQLDGNPPLSVLYTKYDYDDFIAQLAAAANTTNDAADASAAGSVRLSGAVLSCDCRLYYWLLTSARATRVTVLRAAFDDARCRVPLQLSGQAVTSLDPSTLSCPVTCPRGVTCDCSARAVEPDVIAVHCDRTQATREVISALESWDGPVALRVEDAGLPAAPRLQRAVALRLQGNNLTALPPLPVTLRLLDARRNRLTDAAADRWPPHLRLRLRDNPLRCDCDTPDRLRTLHNRRDQVVDYSELQCLEGGSLAALGGACVAAGARAGGAVLGGAIAACGALLAGAAAGLALGARYRHLVKRWLRARGLCLCLTGEDAQDDDLDAEWDVFVSYAHADSHWVLAELLPRLETRWRVCVHVRDWRAGGWIPEQIERSVRFSRRTLAILSPHYAASRWARAELALAQALPASPSPRLLLLLMCAPDALNEELRSAAARHTYIRKDDPWLWDKLTDALPRRPLGPAKDDTRPPPAAALKLDQTATLNAPSQKGTPVPELKVDKPMSLQTLDIDKAIPIPISQLDHSAPTQLSTTLKL